jgi:death-on-curing protein
VTDFLSVHDVLSLHAAQIAMYGGDLGVRSLELLESAVAQPQATYADEYLHDCPFGMAAAYMFHIVQNHPFVDGNKRTGLIAALTFLDLNGIEIDVPTGGLYDLTVSVARGRTGKDEIAEFFRAHAV